MRHSLPSSHAAIQMRAQATPSMTAGHAPARSPPSPASIVWPASADVASSAAASGCRRRAGGRRRRRGLAHERGHDHDALAGRVLRVAGGERQPVVAEVVEHLDLVGADDELLAAPRSGTSPATVVTRISSPCSQLVEPVERRAVGGAVAGDGGVAGLPGQRRVGVVARAPLEVGRPRTPSTTILSTSMAGMRMLGHGVALGRRGRRRGRRRARRGRCGRRTRRGGRDVVGVRPRRCAARTRSRGRSAPGPRGCRCPRAGRRRTGGSARRR